jgi:hypothetical protein
MTRMRIICAGEYHSRYPNVNQYTCSSSPAAWGGGHHGGRKSSVHHLDPLPLCNALAAPIGAGLGGYA